MKIAICTPVHGDTRAGYSQSLANMLVATCRAAPNISLAPMIVPGHLAPTREWLVKESLRIGSDKILWIDADQTFPPHALLRLVAHKLPIVGSNYIRRSEGGGGPIAQVQNEEGKWNYVWTTVEKAAVKALEPVASMGLGLCLMDAEIFHRIEPPWFDIERQPDGSWITDDTYLFRKCAALGILPHVDHALSWETGHIGTQILTHEDATRGFIRHRLAKMAAEGSG